MLTRPRSAVSLTMALRSSSGLSSRLPSLATRITPDFSATIMVPGWPGTKAKVVGWNRPVTISVPATKYWLAGSGSVAAEGASSSWITTRVVRGKPRVPPATVRISTPKLSLPSARASSRMGMLTTFSASPGWNVTLALVLGV